MDGDIDSCSVRIIYSFMFHLWLHLQLGIKFMLMSEFRERRKIQIHHGWIWSLDIYLNKNALSGGGRIKQVSNVRGPLRALNRIFLNIRASVLLRLAEGTSSLCCSILRWIPFINFHLQSSRAVNYGNVLREAKEHSYFPNGNQRTGSVCEDLLC